MLSRSRNAIRSSRLVHASIHQTVACPRVMGPTPKFMSSVAATLENVAANRPIAYWLFGCAGMVGTMVAVGGATRLTRSGLSMVTWKPHGGLPPMTTAEWEEEFELYKTFPEWQTRKNMTLDEFKGIYFWEYSHRMLGRTIGLAFAGPLAYFVLKKRMPKELYGRMAFLLGLGGFQGLVGWWMVRSGLEDVDTANRKEIRVSPFRLATHLALAFTTCGLLAWTGFSVLEPALPERLNLERDTITPDALKKMLRVRKALKHTTNILAFTILSGAFVAGIDAGMAFNTFPKMDDKWIPDGLFEMEPKWRNFFENTPLVQFDHRVLAMTTLAGFATAYGLARHPQVWWQLPTPAKTALNLNIAAVSGQVLLGITTLLNCVPVPLAVAHQTGALVLLTSSVYTLHTLRFARPLSSVFHRIPKKPYTWHFNYQSIMNTAIDTSSRQCDICFDPVPLWDGVTQLCHTNCPAYLCMECTETYFGQCLSEFIPGILSKVHCPICVIPMPLTKCKAYATEDEVDYAETCLFASSEVRCPSCDNSTPFVQSSSPIPPPLLLPSSLRQKIPWLRRLGTKFCRYKLTAAALYDYIAQKFTSHFHLTYQHVLHLIHDPERRATFVLYHLHQIRQVKTPCCKYQVCFECKSQGHSGECDVLSKPAYNSVVTCPLCNIWIVRGDGCDSMKCVCSTYFSWNEQVLIATQRKYDECLKSLFTRIHGRNAMIQVCNYLRQLVWRRRRFRTVLYQFKVICNKKTWIKVQVYLQNRILQRKLCRQNVLDELTMKLKNGQLVSKSKLMMHSSIPIASIAQLHIRTFSYYIRMAEPRSKVPRTVAYGNGNEFNVLLNTGLMDLIQSFNDGKRLVDWTDGELAMKFGYLFLVIHAQKLEFPNENAIDVAAAHGHLELVQWLHRNPQFTWTGSPAAIDCAALGGYEDLVRWLVLNRSDGCTSEALSNAAAGGHLNILKFINEEYQDIPIPAGSYHEAAENGHVNVLKWLPWNFVKNDENGPSCLMDSAAKNGHIKVAEFLEKINAVESMKAMDYAAEGGHLEMLKWLHERGYQSISTDAMNWAANCGHLEVIKYLHEHREEGCTTDAADFAAENAFLDILKWLFTNRSEGETAGAFDLAAKNGHLHIVEWLHANRGVGGTTAAMDGAARRGNIKMLDWLRVHRTEGCSTNAMEFAAEKGHIDVLNWLQKHTTAGCTTDAMDSAAMHNQLDALIWLHENRTEGCTAEAMAFAAEQGHLRIIQWLHENRTEGCTTDAMDWAARNNHLHVVHWLHDNRGEGCSADIVDVIIRAGHLRLLQWWYQHRRERCTLNAIGLACEYGHLPIVVWLHEIGEKTTFKAMNLAAEGGYLHIVKWLHTNRTEGCSIDAIEAVLTEEHPQIFKWLCINRTELKLSKCLKLTKELGSRAQVQWLKQFVQTKKDLHKGNKENKIAMDELNSLREADLVRWTSKSKKSDVSSYRSAQKMENMLHIAARRGFEAWTRILLEKSVNVNDQDAKGQTPLIVAIEMNNFNVFQVLLDANTDLTLKTSSGQTAFAIAAHLKQTHMTQAMLPKLKDHGAMELFIALQEQSVDSLRELLDTGISPAIYRPDASQLPALHATIDNELLLQVLLKKDASIVDMKDRLGQTALALAAMQGNLKACQTLIKFGANIDSRDIKGRSVGFLVAIHEQEEVLKYFLAQFPKSFSINTKDDEQRTPLHVHAENGNLSGCQLVVKYHAKLNALDAFGWTPMHLASSLGHMEVCAYLSGQGALQLDCNDSAICKPLNIPSMWISVTYARLCLIYNELFECGLPQTIAKYGTLRIRDLEMNTLLHLAAQHVSMINADYLLKALQSTGSIPVNVHNCYNQTPLHESQTKQRHFNSTVLKSMGSKDYTSLRGLLLQDQKLNEFNQCEPSKLSVLLSEISEGYCYLGDQSTQCISSSDGNTVLHALIETFKEKSPFPTVESQIEILSSPNWLGSHEAGVEYLIEKTNWFGLTPLHIAASIGATGFCKVLVDHGANVSTECGPLDERLKDPGSIATEGWRALNFALESNASEELVLYFLDQSNSLPKTSAAIAHLKSAIANNYPILLPLLHHRLDDESKSNSVIMEATTRCEEFFQSNGHDEIDNSAILLFKIVIEADLYGIDILKKYECKDLVIRPTGDTLLHVFVADTSRDRIPELAYLVTQAKIPVNSTNNRRMTALHYACKYHRVAIVSFLLGKGADICAICYTSPSFSRQEPDILGANRIRKEDKKIISNNPAERAMWSTPLQLCLSHKLEKLDPKQLQANSTIIEMLLQYPESLMETSARWDGSHLSDNALCHWNEFIFDKIATDFQFALPLYLNHYMSSKVWYGTTTQTFYEVKQVCQNLVRITQCDNSRVMLHPTVRNALRAKWKLFGRRIYRKELCLAVLLLLFFTASNYKLASENEAQNGSSNLSLSFDTADDCIAGIFKILAWLLALYHLVYVEIWQEWRLNTATYWRSWWNYINFTSYLLLLLSIPMDLLNVPPSIKESCLSVASILLLFGLMQSLLVFSYFSVLLFTFSRMLNVALKFCLLYTILLVGFTGAFYLIYHGSLGNTSLTESLATVFFITFGELNFRDNYASAVNPYRYTFGLVIIVVYLICVNIVGINMLIAMMTSEYDVIKNRAEVLAVKELASTLHRYESWLGAKALEKVYESDELQSFTKHQFDTDRHAAFASKLENNKNPKNASKSLLDQLQNDLSRTIERSEDAQALKSQLNLVSKE
ncbi:hypothetical protein THRCLA_09393, partial [Thraustotheca clavata]